METSSGRVKVGNRNLLQELIELLPRPARCQGAENPLASARPDCRRVWTASPSSCLRAVSIPAAQGSPSGRSRTIRAGAG